jgi:DNA polymerase V
MRLLINVQKSKKRTLMTTHHTTATSGKRGGARPGAGRKHNTGKFKEPTQSIRVPVSTLEVVTDWLEQIKHGVISALPTTAAFLKNLNGMTIMDMAPSPTPSAMPFYDCSVSAGFPSPADDSFGITMDLNKHLVQNAPATFFVRTSGDSMLGAGIHDGDLLVVDRSLTAKHQDIVIAAVNGDLTVKRLMHHHNKTILQAENPEFSNIELTEDMAVSLWGVVTNVIHSLRA